MKQEMAKKKYQNDKPIKSLAVFTVVSYFIFQGTRYMTPGERWFKISLTLIFALIFRYAGLGFGVALIVGHALNFVTTGQIPVMMRYVVSDVGLNRSKVLMALEKIKATAPRFGIVEVLIYGSFCRHVMKSTSDLDLRIQHRSGVFQSIMAYFYAAYIRIWANLNFIPIDLYCFTEANFLDRMRDDEIPALLFSSEEMCRKYPDNQDPVVSLEKNEALP
jgi:predicted nucleotidyltransferase